MDITCRIWENYCKQTTKGRLIATARGTAEEAAWEAEGTMFYKMIERARERWYASPDCTIGNIIDYMTRQGNLRDAQIGAIKTYLFPENRLRKQTSGHSFFSAEGSTH